MIRLPGRRRLRGSGSGAARGDRDRGPDADLRGPGRYLIWLLRCQPWRVARGALLGTLWMVALSGPPYVVSRAVDEGLRDGRTDRLVLWTVVLVVLGIVTAVLGMYRHRTMTMIRMDASVRTVRALVRTPPGPERRSRGPSRPARWRASAAPIPAPSPRP